MHNRVSPVSWKDLKGWLNICAWTSTLKNLLKADMKSDILLQTAAIFFLSNLSLKQGIGAVYVMVCFICKGYLELSGSGELQNEKVLPTVGFEPEAFRLRREGATTDLRVLMPVVGIKVHLV